MNWDTVKETVAQGIYSMILQSRSTEAMTTILMDLVFTDRSHLKGHTIHEAPKIYADKAWDVIMKWDIRCVGRLRELFPGFFPKTLSKHPLVAEMDEKGVWQVYVLKLGANT